MNRKENFKKYLISIGKSPKSSTNYMCVFRQAKNKGMDIETVSLKEIRKAAAEHLATEEGKAQNIKGKHMYSAALTQFDKYIESRGVN